jgi:hypothetical protein
LNAGFGFPAINVSEVAIPYSLERLIDEMRLHNPDLAVAEYHTGDAFVYGSAIRRFDPVTGPTAYQGRVMLDGAPAQGPLVAACLITGATSRLACVEVVADAGGGLWVSPIPVSDSRVARIVRVDGLDGDPECGACV